MRRRRAAGGPRGATASLPGHRRRGSRLRRYTCSELKEKAITELSQVARELGVESAAGLRKQELIFRILQAQAERNGLIFARGRARDACPTASASSAPRVQLPARPGRHLRLAVADPAVRPAHRRHHLGQIRPPKEGERYFALIKVEAVNFEAPGDGARTGSSSTT